MDSKMSEAKKLFQAEIEIRKRIFKKKDFANWEDLPLEIKEVYKELVQYYKTIGAVNEQRSKRILHRVQS